MCCAHLGEGANFRECGARVASKIKFPFLNTSAVLLHDQLGKVSQKSQPASSFSGRDSEPSSPRSSYSPSMREPSKQTYEPQVHGGTSSSGALSPRNINSYSPSDIPGNSAHDNITNPLFKELNIVVDVAAYDDPLLINMYATQTPTSSFSRTDSEVKAHGTPPMQ